MASKARRRPWWSAFAVLVCLALVAAACGDDDDDGGTESASDTTTSEDTDGATGDDDEAGEDAESMEPVRGGDLVYGLEADSANPWAPYGVSCASSCFMVLRSVADSLVLVNEEGDWVPNLAESIEPNEDYTEWTFTIRDGITFHDGTPLDGAAVRYNMQTTRASGLTAAAYTNIVDITADGQDVTFVMGTPWVAFPYYMAGQGGYMMSPDWLRTLESNPLRSAENPLFDQETADTPADGNPSAPVGTGPFVYESYSPGNGNSFKATRNEDYWRGDGPDATGEGLPYLDSIELVVSVDIQSRSAGLESGQFDMFHTANADEIAKFQDRDDAGVLASDDNASTSYTMINVAQGTNESLGGIPLDPSGANADNPLIHLSCRKALAHAVDRERYVEERTAGLTRVASGPFPPGSVGYLEDAGYPAYDPDAALAEMETCKEEAGTDTISFNFDTTNDPFNVESNQLVISMWQEVFGDTVDVNINPVEQGQYIGLALSGSFDALGWRAHGSPDPDAQLIWWVSQTAAPIGTSALNFNRFTDEVIDGAFATIRTNPDPQARVEAAETINRRFGEMVYNWWTYWTLWGVMYDPAIHGLEDFELMDGSQPAALSGGVHQIAQLWCDGGDCG